MSQQKERVFKVQEREGMASIRKVYASHQRRICTVTSHEMMATNVYHLVQEGCHRHSEIKHYILIMPHCRNWPGRGLRDRTTLNRTTLIQTAASLHPHRPRPGGVAGGGARGVGGVVGAHPVAVGQLPLRPEVLPARGGGEEGGGGVLEARMSRRSLG